MPKRIRRSRAKDWRMPEVVMHISTHCDVGLMRCGVKLTDENRRNYQGWQCCPACRDKQRRRDAERRMV